MISGSLRLSGVSFKYPPQPVVEPVVGSPDSSQGAFFSWAVPGGDLGSHKVGQRLVTTLSATFGGIKITDYAVSAGTLPPDIALNKISGILIGTLTTTGHYVFTIRASLDAQSSDATYSLLVE